MFVPWMSVFVDPLRLPLTESFLENVEWPGWFPGCLSHVTSVCPLLSFKAREMLSKKRFGDPASRIVFSTVAFCAETAAEQRSEKIKALKRQEYLTLIRAGNESVSFDCLAKNRNEWGGEDKRNLVKA